MKKSSLVQNIIPVRHRSVTPPTEGLYNIRKQRQEFTINGDTLPADIRASDGGSDTIKITDKTIDR